MNKTKTSGHIYGLACRSMSSGKLNVENLMYPHNKKKTFNLVNFQDDCVREYIKF